MPRCYATLQIRPTRKTPKAISAGMEAQDHILIVDDDAEIRSLLGDYLQKNGYKASVAADGKAMWTALARGKVDLIVLDLMLPGEDGLSLCRKLRARIKSVLRRPRSLPQNLRADAARTIAFAGWRLDTIARHLVSAEGVVTSLGDR